MSSPSVFLELSELRPQPLQLRLRRLEPVLYALQLLWLDHGEGFILEVHLVGLATLLLVSLLVLLLVIVTTVLSVLLLLLDLFLLGTLEGVKGASIDKAVWVIVLVGDVQLRGINILVVLNF